MMPVSLRDARKATACYAAVFSYTLTPAERARWLFFYRMRAGYDRKSHPLQEDKLRKAEEAARWLAAIPTVQLVGVTGGLAMNNAKAGDDIDLLIITSPGTLWVTRLLATALMDIVGVRRRPGEREVADKICLNMFMDAGSLAVPAGERDCFVAHEVLQMTPVWAQDGVYRKFLSANRWVRRYLPNAWAWRMRTRVPRAYASLPIACAVFRLFEGPARYLQLWYMKRHRTREVLTDTALRFHPRDARVWVKRRFAAKLRPHRIPLDKVFYAG